MMEESTERDTKILHELERIHARADAFEAALRAVFDHVMAEHRRTAPICASGWVCVGHLGGLAAKGLGLDADAAQRIMDAPR